MKPLVVGYYWTVFFHSFLLFFGVVESMMCASFFHSFLLFFGVVESMICAAFLCYVPDFAPFLFSGCVPDFAAINFCAGKLC